MNLKMVYSFSQINLYQQCPRKYQYRYIEKIDKEFETTPDLLLGSCVHKALERLYMKVNNFVVPNEKEVLEYFYSARDMGVEDATKDDKPFETKNHLTLEDYKRRGTKYIQNYYEKYQPFDHVQVIAIEEMMHFHLEPSFPSSHEFKFRGVIDRLDKEGENTFIINDYKTNKILPPEAKDGYIDQLTLYGLGIKQKYGKYFTNIKARLHYLHFDMIDERDITADLLQTTVDKYANIIAGIEKERFDFNMGNRKSFAPRDNFGCKYCEYQSICPLRAHLKFPDERVGGELSEKTIKGLVDEYSECGKQERYFKAQKEIIKDILIHYMENKNLQRLFGNTDRISGYQTTNISIKDKEALRVKLQELGVLNEALEIDRFKLQKLIKEEKIQLNDLGESIQKLENWILRASSGKEGKADI